MEQFEKFLELISNYGLSIVIAAIAIITVVSERKKSQKYFEQLFQKMITRDEENEHFHDSIEDKKYDSTYKAIYDMLKSLRELTDSARCYVFMYHNGGKNLNGIPFQKLSCISESDAPGIKPIIMDYQVCQRSIFSGLCSDLRKDGHLYVHNVEDIAEGHTVLHEMLISRSTNSAYFSSINNYKTNTVIGFIGVEFIEKHTDEEINKTEKLLENSSVRISGLMEVISNDSDSQSQ